MASGAACMAAATVHAAPKADHIHPRARLTVMCISRCTFFITSTGQGLPAITPVRSVSRRYFENLRAQWRSKMNGWALQLYYARAAGHHVGAQRVEALL